MFLSRSKIMFLLLFSSLLTLSSCLSRQYYFVNVNKNWTEAQAFCRQSYIDLATIENDNDQSSVIAAVNGSYNSQIWIGQYEDVQNSWRWYLDDDAFYGVGERNYRNWGSNAPDNNGGKEMCTQMMSNGFWNDVNCNLLAKFICYNGSSNSNIMISLSMNVSDARQYCRQYYTDLVSIRNATEDQQIFNLAAGQAVWIGLYRTRLWSDQSNSTYGNWLTGEPNNMGGNEHCTAMWMYYSGLWNDSPCNFAYPFICYRLTLSTPFTTETATTTSTTVQI
ncbi:macrophage mannose receptor 1-like [Colossoma macropomum]|uniref:macrophage mannose receptor 1-like n=1 Tax=Colossoma macropomum TaxID=42526 RepID=UPI0018641628|nr:macrophage mannose receptor 1-like [Colossoma macropomum]